MEQKIIELSKLLPSILIPKKNREFTKAIYIVGSKSALYNGHAGLILVGKEGNGIFYSTIFSVEKTPSVLLCKNAPFKLFRKEMTATEITKYFQTGRIPNIQDEFVHNYYLNNFDKYITIPIKTRSQSHAIYTRAESIARSPGMFNIVEYNCNHVTQDILAAGGLNFTPIRSEKAEFQKNIHHVVENAKKIRPIRVAYYSAIAFHSIYDTGIVPNGAYSIGLEWAKKNNYSYGTIKIVKTPPKKLIPQFT